MLSIRFITYWILAAFVAVIFGLVMDMFLDTGNAFHPRNDGAAIMLISMFGLVLSGAVIWKLSVTRLTGKSDPNAETKALRNMLLSICILGGAALFVAFLVRLLIK